MRKVNRTNKTAPDILPSERIVRRIFLMRDKKVMLDSDLAELYGIETGALTRAVRRNSDRFPGDFAFRLSKEEFDVLRCQFGTSNEGRGGRRYTPLVFTEHGVLMLSNVLKSKRAVQMSLQIVRTFIQLREILSNYKVLREKIEVMERKYDKRFKIVFDALHRFLEEEKTPKRRIGFGVE